MPKKATAFAAGKLYIAGEYAVVTPGNPALLVGVNRGVTVTVTERAGAQGLVTAAVYAEAGISWSWVENQTIMPVSDSLSLVFAAMQMLENYRQILGIPAAVYDLDISTELVSKDGVKLGLGSSGAVVVAVIAALSKFYAIDLDTWRLYQLAMLTSANISPAGSGGDIAASITGGWLLYQAPDRVAIAQGYREAGLQAVLTDPAWSDAKLLSFQVPHSLQLLVAWSASAASTEQQLASRAVQDTEAQERFLAQSANIVNSCKQALIAGEYERVAQEIAKARSLLQGYAQTRGILLETAAHKQAIRAALACGAAAKTSGAGAGDCAIAIASDPLQAQKISAAWASAQVQQLDLKVTPVSVMSSQ